MNKTIYFKKEEPRANWKYLGMVLLLLFVFADSMAFGESADSVSVGTTNSEVINSAANGKSADSVSVGAANAGVVSSAANEQYLTVISVVVAILAMLTTIAILIPTIIAFIQIRRVEKEWERFTEMVGREWEQRISALHESVMQFSHPAEILKEAAEKAEAITETEVKALREFIFVFEENLKERLNKLQSGFEKEKASLDELTITLNSVKLELDKKPSSSDILVQVGEKYKVPDDLMEIVLQKVGLALFCLRNVSEEERKEIMKVLSVNPRVVEKKEE